MSKCIEHDTEHGLTAAHSFQPRYHEFSGPDREAITILENDQFLDKSQLAHLQATKRIYVGDICVHCGVFVATPEGDNR